MPIFLEVLRGNYLDGGIDAGNICGIFIRLRLDSDRIGLVPARFTQHIAVRECLQLNGLESRIKILFPDVYGHLEIIEIPGKGGPAPPLATEHGDYLAPGEDTVDTVGRITLGKSRDW